MEWDGCDSEEERVKEMIEEFQPTWIRMRSARPRGRALAAVHTNIHFPRCASFLH